MIDRFEGDFATNSHSLVWPNPGFPKEFLVRVIKAARLHRWLGGCRDLGRGLQSVKVFRGSLSANYGDLVVDYIVLEPLIPLAVT